MTLTKEDDQIYVLYTPYVHSNWATHCSRLPSTSHPPDLKRQHPSSLGNGRHWAINYHIFVRQSALMDPLSTLFLVM